MLLIIILTYYIQNFEIKLGVVVWLTLDYFDYSVQILYQRNENIIKGIYILFIQQKIRVQWISLILTQIFVLMESHEHGDIVIWNTKHL